MKHNTSNDNSAFEDIFQKMEMIEVAFLCAQGEDNIISRPMMAQFDEDDRKSLYFISSSNAEQVEALIKNPNAVATMTDSSNKIYIEAKGQCQITQSKEKIKPFWNAMVDTWFPEGLKDSDVSLIKLSLESLECWDSSGNIIMKAANLLMAKLTNTIPNLGEKTSVVLNS